MQKNRVIPALMAGLLAGVLTGCSSSGSSYRPDHAADAAQQEKTKKILAEQEKIQQQKKAAEQAQSVNNASAAEEKQVEQKPTAEKPQGENKPAENTQAEPMVTPPQADKMPMEPQPPAKEQMEKEQAQAEQAAKLNWRDFLAVPSQGDTFEPVMKQDGNVFYSSGPRVVKAAGKTLTLDNEAVQYDRDFFKHHAIDPSKVQQLVVTDNSGNALGTFQFVNQQYSSYSNFMSAQPANEYGETDRFEPLAFYTAKPSTAEQLAAQKGNADYIGKAIGYRRDSQGDLTTEMANADVKFNVNFDKKTISGRIDNRFDDLGYNSSFWVMKYDDDDNEIYYPEYANRKNQPLILKETQIKVNDQGQVSFGGENGRAERNVAVEFKGELKDISQYGGVFSGPNLEEVVGQIGGGEERISFGATKQAQ